jgi:hypothetical protein
MSEKLPKRKGSKKENLLADPNVKRWYDNVANGSVSTAEIALRRLGYYCELNNTIARNMMH